MYGTLVGLVNAKQSAIGAAVVNMANELFQQSLNEGNWLHAKFVVRIVDHMLDIRPS
jgi:hypothetical protein